MRITKLTYLIIFVLFFAIYAWMGNPRVAPEGDSGELVTVAYTLGIAHPPGYPLYTLVGHVFSLIPINSVGWRLNMMAGFFHSLTLVFFLAILNKLTKNLAAALVGTAVLGFSYTYWLYSLIAEVFSLNDFLAMVALYLILELSIRINDQKFFKYLVLTVFVFGMGLANHQSIVLVLPAVFFWLWPLKNKALSLFWKSKIKFTVSILVAGLIGILTYAYILIRAKTGVVPVAWTYPQMIHDLMNMFLRTDYGTFSSLHGVDPSLVTPMQKFNQVWTYVKFLIDDFSYPGVIFYLLGAIVTFFKNRRVGIFLMLSFFLTGIFFLTYANFPYSEASGTGLEIIERFYLLPNLFFAMFVGIGMGAFVNWGRNKFAWRYLTLPIVIVYAAWLFIGHFDLVNQRENYRGWNLAKDILDSAPKGAIVYPSGDVGIFVAFYARYVEGYRPDLEVITPNDGRPNNDFRYLRSRRPDLNVPKFAPTQFPELLLANAGKNPIYFSTIFGDYIFNSSEYVASPTGFLTHLVKRDKVQSIAAWNNEVDNLTEHYTPPLQGNTSGDFVVQSNYFIMYYSLGTYCLSAKEFNCAAKYFELAKKTDPSRVETYLGLAYAAEQLNECTRAEENFLYVLHLNANVKETYVHLYNLAKNCFKDEAKASRYTAQRDSYEQMLGGNLKDL